MADKEKHTGKKRTPNIYHEQMEWKTMRESKGRDKNQKTPEHSKPRTTVKERFGEVQKNSLNKLKHL